MWYQFAAGGFTGHCGDASMKSSWFQKYLLPGFIYQSAIIAGGYATGRELAEFFLPGGALGGLMGMAVAALIWSAALALTFEFARLTKSYDYRTFFRALLGRFWVLFEIAWVATAFLVLSIIGAAAGAIAEETLGVPAIVGTGLLCVSIGLLVFYGSTAIERFLTAWSLVLYATYAVFIGWCFLAFGGEITASLATLEVRPGWLGNGVAYASYNISAIAVVLFCIRHITSRKEALGAGLIAGPLAMAPGVMFYLAMIAFSPDIADETVPANFLLAKLGSPVFQIIFYVVVFGTLIETGAAIVHSINERVAAVYRERDKQMPAALRPAVAIGMLVTALTIAVWVGLVELIGKGYWASSYVFLAILVVPLFTVGLFRIIRATKR